MGAPRQILLSPLARPKPPDSRFSQSGFEGECSRGRFSISPCFYTSRCKYSRSELLVLALFFGFNNLPLLPYGAAGSE
jgi:hypothetical protein